MSYTPILGSGLSIDHCSLRVSKNYGSTSRRPEASNFAMTSNPGEIGVAGCSVDEEGRQREEVKAYVGNQEVFSAPLKGQVCNSLAPTF